MKYFAETLRWLGFLTMLAGAATGIALIAPTAYAGAAWLVLQFGPVLSVATAILLGYVIFHIGEWISPHART